MKFIEIEKSVKQNEWSMTDLHSHEHYELYFLFSGARNFFLKDKMYKIEAPCYIVIPPYTMHKTEGSGFMRINVNVMPDALSDYEISALNRLSANENIAALPQYTSAKIYELLTEGLTVFNVESEQANEVLKATVTLIIYYLTKAENQKTFSPLTAKNKNVSPVVLNVIDYLSKNFEDEIRLEPLAKRFFMSKTALCSSFKKAMNCTIGEYVSGLKLNKAKEYLTNTKKSVEEISALCGFSSATYMGLVFKKKTGVSPLNYRKIQNTKS